MVLCALNIGEFLSALSAAGERADTADDRLQSVSSVSRTPLRSPPETSTVAEVADHSESGDPILVPVVVCPLDVESEPEMDAVFQYVSAVCDRLRLVYADDHVRQFDVRFEFGPDRLLRSRDSRRVTVPPEMADRLSEPDYDYRDLRREVERGDDGDPVTPPVYWGECVRYTTGGGAAGATAATTAGGF